MILLEFGNVNIVQCSFQSYTLKWEESRKNINVRLFKKESIKRNIGSNACQQAKRTVRPVSKSAYPTNILKTLKLVSETSVVH